MGPHALHHSEWGDEKLPKFMDPSAPIDRKHSIKRYGLFTVDCYNPLTANAEQITPMKPPPSFPISAKLFCKCSHVAFMPYGLVSRDERRTSNIERPTPNENKYQIPNIQHSMLDVRCSMFIFSDPPTQKQLSAYPLISLTRFIIIVAAFSI